MTFLPIAPWVVLALLAAAAGLLVWWPPGAAEAQEGLSGRLRRSGAVLLLLVAAARPGVPGGSVTGEVTDLDVFFLVDTTSSVVAEDYDGGRTRLEGIRADVTAIATGLAGARYSLLTFDHQSVTRLPLTSDGQALATAIEVLQVETSTYSQGSSPTVAAPDLDAALQRDREDHPDRSRLVFYLGDGEQTSAEPPTPFDPGSGLVDGGAVLGYGTTQGGRMKESGTQRDAYLVDPSTGQPAISTIDERGLQDIASQLSVPYLHRTGPGDPAVLDLVPRTALTSSSPTSAVALAGRIELYWVALLLLALVAAWEAAATLAPVRLRDPRPPSAPPSHPTTGGLP